MLVDVTEKPPDIVLLNDEAFDGYESRRFSRQFPELVMWLARDYYLWQQLAGFDVYLKKNDGAKRLIQDDYDFPIEVSGMNRIENVSFMGQDVQCLIQTGNSNVKIPMNITENNTIYSMVFVRNAPEYSEARCTLKVSADDRVIREIRISSDDPYANLVAFLPEDHTEALSIQLSVSWDEETGNGSLVWFEPTVIPAEHTGFYC